MKKILALFILVLFVFAEATVAYSEPVSTPSLLMLMQDVKSAIRQAKARYESGNVTGAADLAKKILEK